MRYYYILTRDEQHLIKPIVDKNWEPEKPLCTADYSNTWRHFVVWRWWIPQDRVVSILDVFPGNTFTIHKEKIFNLILQGIRGNTDVCNLWNRKQDSGIHKMKFCGASKRNEADRHETAWIHLLKRCWGMEVRRWWDL